VQTAVQVCSGGCGVYFLFFYGRFHYGPVRQVSTVCEKIYMIMVEVIEKVMDDHVLGVLVGGVCGYGFWYLCFRWTPSVGVPLSSVSHAVCVEGLVHL
jgi:hypothetical protein